MLAVVGHHIVGGDKRGYISTGFFRQEVIDFPIIRFPSGTADGLVDGARAAIVSGNHQIPVLVNGIQILQIAGGSPGGLDWIAAFVNETVAFQTIHFSGSQHELPQSASACA